MATKKLGISGSEVTLPATLTLSLPVRHRKQLESQEMADGSLRYNIKSSRKEWWLTWTKLTKAQLDVLTTLWNYNQTLRWQNNDESATWYTVMITLFDYDSIDPISTTKYYEAWMRLEEAI